MRGSLLMTICLDDGRIAGTARNMPRKLQFDILPQPDDSTCGPTCLHSVYRYYGDEIPLEQVVEEAPMLEQGGTLAVYLGCHALQRGYRARIYIYNLKVFDPTWFHFHDARTHRELDQVAASLAETQNQMATAGKEELMERLAAQAAVKNAPRLQAACRAYSEYLSLGGEIVMRDLSASLIRRYLRKSIPILTGLSSTYLYRNQREFGPHSDPDDVRGYPVGHFVVLCGYDQNRRTVRVADPLLSNPIVPEEHFYEVRFSRLVCSILLGVLTYDANLLIIEPDPNAPPGSAKR
jgi:hypothetical protein